MSEKDIRFAKARNEMQKEKKVVEERGRDEGRILAAEKNAIRSAIYSPPSPFSPAAHANVEEISVRKVKMSFLHAA